MTDAVAIALITSGFGTITAAVTTAGLIISRKARDAARYAARKVDEVHGQAVQNWSISQANHETLAKVVEQTDGNVRKLQEVFEQEARRREAVAWRAAFEVGRRAEMTKNRRASDALAVKDEEPK